MWWDGPIVRRARNSWTWIASLAVVLLAVQTAEAGAAFPGQNGRIAYSRPNAAFSASAIWTVNPDGSDQRQLTTASGFNDSPAWSPDGRRIAFSSNRDGDFDIYVMNADGTGQTNVTRAAGTDNRPTWSPDGRMIAFDSDRGPASPREIYVMNADGTGQRSVSTGGHDDLAPAWHPNGSRIGFYSNESVTGPGAPRQLVDVRPDGVDRRPISTTTAIFHQDPSFAPDASRLAVWSPPPGGGPAEIYSFVPDGSGVLRLTNNNSIDLTPAWAPDGRQIAFISSRGGSSEIFIMNADGSNQRAITSTALDEGDPDWGPAPPQPPIPPIVDAPPVPVNADGDGFPAPADCDDANPAVHPGAREIPGNATDENCDRILGQFGRVTAPVENQWAAGRRSTRVIRLIAKQLPADARVTVRCRGRGCPFRNKVRRPSKKRVVLHRLFRQRRLRVGTVVEIRITRPQTIGKVVRYTVRARRVPRSQVLCLTPGTSGARRC